MARDVISEAIVLLELENRAGDDLARAVAEFKAEAAALGREKAEIKLKADISDLKAKMAEARAEFKALQAVEREERATAKALSGDAKKESLARVKELKEERLAQQEVINGHQAEMQQLRRKADVFRQVNALSNKLNQERIRGEKDAAAATKASQQAEDEATKAVLRRAEATRKSLDLQKQYLAAQERANNFTKALSRAQGSDKVRVKLDQSRALAEMEVLHLKLAALGDRPITQKVSVDASGLSRTRRALSGIGNAFGFNRQDQIRGLLGDLNTLAGGFLKTRVNVLGLTVSIGGLVAGMFALAPVIVGVVGALGSLVSVTGAAIGGAAGIGGAGLLGFGMAALGITTAIKPFVSQLQQAHKWTMAYNQALAKYGEGSKQATKAQHQLQNELKSLPPEVRNTVIGFADLKAKWQSLTSAVATHDIGNIIGESFKTVRADMGFFAHDTNQAFNAITAGWSKWMQQLRSGGAQADLNNIFQNFNASIPSLTSGLGHLAAAFGRMFSQFSNFLPSLAHGFDSWAAALDRSSAKSNGFIGGVRTMVGALRTFGHFAQAAGRFLVDFFKAGVQPGSGLLDRMTNSLNKLSGQMNTVAGQRKLTDFFSQSIDTTVGLWKAILPLLSALVKLANVLAPVGQVTLDVLSAFTKFASFLVGFKPFQWAIGGLAALAIVGRLTSALREMGSVAFDVGKRLLVAFATSSSMGPINALKAAFTGFGKSGIGAQIGTTAAAEMEAAAPGIGRTIGLNAAAGMEAGAATAAAEQRAGGAVSGIEQGAAGAAGVRRVESAAAGTVGALGEGEAAASGFGAALAGLAGPATLAVGGLAALGAGIFALTSGTNSAAKAQEGLKEAIKGANAAASANRSVGVLPGIRNQGVPPAAALRGDQASVNALQREYNDLVAKGQTNTSHFHDVLDQLNGSLLQQRADQTAVNNSLIQARDVHQKAANVISKSVTTAYNGLTKAQNAFNLADANAKNEATAGALDQRASALKALRKSQQEYNTALQQAHDAQLRLSADDVNAARVAAGRVAATNDQALSVGRLNEQIKKVGGPTAQKAFSFIVHLPNPADIQRISDKINQLNPKDKTAAINVLAHTNNAKDALNQINGIQLRTKSLTVRMNIGDTLAKLAQIRGINLPAKTLRLLHAGDPATISAVARINGLGLPAKTLRLLGNMADAQAKYDQTHSLPDLRKLLSINGDASNALGVFAAVQGAMAAIQSVITVTVRAVTSGFAMGGISGRLHAFANSKASAYNAAHPAPKKPSGPGGGRSITSLLHATGGISTNANGFSDNGILYNQQVKAAKEAAQRAMQDSKRGGLHNRPIYLVGEENRNEYVIATNPAYRRSNVGYLSQAAKEFGYQLTPAAKGRGAKKAVTPHGAPVGLPAADRIGGVGTSDIQNAVQAAQTAYDNFHNKVFNKTDSRGHHVAPSSRERSTDRANLTKLRTLQSFLGSANNYIQQFTNLETQITAVESYMTAAANSPSDVSFGYGSNGQPTIKSWSDWRTFLVQLEGQHTGLLQRALNDAKGKVGNNPNAAQLGYVRTLQAALGQSIVDQQTAQNAALATPPQLTLDDFVTGIGQRGFLDQLNYNFAVAQTNNVADLPGTAAREDLASLGDDLTASQNLMNFYQSVLSRAQATRNLPLMTSAADAFTQARSAYQQLQDQFTAAATASGPSQQQLADTARAQVLLNYGSNINSLLGLPSNNSASITEALSQNVVNSLSGSAAPMISPNTASAQRIINVNNNYATVPEDPHLYSQSLSWELEAAL